MATKKSAKKFEVIVRRAAVQAITLNVFAKDEEQAKDFAHEQLEELEAYDMADWEYLDEDIVEYVTEVK